MSATAPHAAPYIGKFVEHINAGAPQFGMTTPDRMACFLAQTCYESQNYSRMRENLTYLRAQRLIDVFGRRYFPSLEIAQHYVANPDALADLVYANRYGNTTAADQLRAPHRFIGRGLIQITFYANYLMIGQRMGLDLITQPELLEEPEHAVRAAYEFFNWKHINDFVDRNDFGGATGQINAKREGLEARLDLFNEFRSALQ